jgi:tRNA(His) guanylyltransferase
MRVDFDRLGDRHKRFEGKYAGEAIMPGVPVLARLDGRGFHNFTKGLKRPFDPDLSYSMQVVTKYLLEQSNATVGYTQSDEITLCWPNVEVDETKIFFVGKLQKLCSVLAAMATVKFNDIIRTQLPTEYGDRLPVFDCRVWQVPNLDVAAENFLWREMDATKNSITMAASTYYSERELNGIPSKERVQMLHDKGIKWAAYPDFFKKGSYFKRKKIENFLTPEEMAFIKPEFRPVGPIERNVIDEVTLPKATSIANFPEVLFSGAEPVVENVEEVVE